MDPSSLKRIEDINLHITWKWTQQSTKINNQRQDNVKITCFTNDQSNCPTYLINRTGSLLKEGAKNLFVHVLYSKKVRWASLLSEIIAILLNFQEACPPGIFIWFLHFWSSLSALPKAIISRAIYNPFGVEQPYIIFLIHWDPLKQMAKWLI